jgi:hypothetical protein
MVDVWGKRFRFDVVDLASHDIWRWPWNFAEIYAKPKGDAWGCLALRLDLVIHIRDCIADD